jgi:hypothetical protein
MNDDLLSRIRARATNPETIHDMAQGLSPAPHIYPRATPEQIAAEEQALGFALPALYKRILTKIGNGGFGPGYGLIGAQGGCDGFSAGSLAENYALLRKEGPDGSGTEWPAYVLPICTWGCGIDSCLDCSKPEAPVLVYSPDVHVLDDGILEATLTNAEGEVIWEYRPDEDEGQAPPPAASAKVELLLHMTSLETWIAAWADGVDLWEDMENTL